MRPIKVCFYFSCKRINLMVSWFFQCKQIARRDEEMAPYITESKRNYVFGGISSVAANASIKVCFCFSCSLVFFVVSLQCKLRYPTYISYLYVHPGTCSNEVNQLVRSPANMQEFDSSGTGEVFI